MKREKKYGTDIIPEDVQTSVHNISFTFIAIVIGVIVFWLSQVLFAVKEGVVTFDDVISISQTEETDTKPVEITPEKDLGHNYCGTFFIWQTVGNNYKSVENYNAYLEYQEKGRNWPVLMDESMTDPVNEPVASRAGQEASGTRTDVIYLREDEGVGGICRYQSCEDLKRCILECLQRRNPGDHEDFRELSAVREGRTERPDNCAWYGISAERRSLL